MQHKAFFTTTVAAVLVAASMGLASAVADTLQVSPSPAMLFLAEAESAEHSILQLSDLSLP